MIRVLQPPGEVCDRLVILALKVDRLTGAARDRARELHDALLDGWRAASLSPCDTLPEFAELQTVNRALWDVEDRLREAEREARFDSRFVADARSVYRLNDRRAALKRAIDERLGADGTEPKSW